jgi:hypothetical protein
MTTVEYDIPIRDDGGSPLWKRTDREHQKDTIHYELFHYGSSVSLLDIEYVSLILQMSVSSEVLLTGQEGNNIYVWREVA